MRGLDGVHNMLLGGDGNDRIFAGNLGDVIWGTRTPAGSPKASTTGCTAAPAPTGSTPATGSTTSGRARATTTSLWSTATGPCTATGRV
jgi:hypothetical protein